MDRLMLGDNQFFGINHMSEERARAQALKFSNIEAIMEVIEGAHCERVFSLMCTTHVRMRQVAERLRANPERFGGFRLLPCMPYAHKYADAVTQEGYLGALRSLLPQGVVNGMFRGGLSVARKDIDGIIKLLVDSEMRMFEGLPTPTIFLQNVVVDLLLGLQLLEPFVVFDKYVRERYGALPGYITMNMPMLVDALDRIGIVNPVVCCNFNKIGFRMSGGIELYEDYLTSRSVRCIAMSVFASGALPPDEALEWVCAHPNIESIVFGASSRGNIRRTREVVERAWGVSSLAGREVDASTMSANGSATVLR